MNRALAYGLMGAAEGVLGGISDVLEQEIKDAHTEKLRKARLQEHRVVAAMEHQYRSQENVQRFHLQLSADLQRDKQDFKQKSTLNQQVQQAKQAQMAQTQTFKASQSALDRASRQKIAKIRAADDNTSRPLGDAVYQNKDGTYAVVKGGQTPPAGSRLVVTSGGSIGPYRRQHMAPAGMLNSYGTGPQGFGGKAPASAPTPSPPPGATHTNPVDASALTAPPPRGTWIRRPDGAVVQYQGQK